MSDPTPYIYIGCFAAFILGMVTGIIIVYLGFKLGFRANIEARLLEDEVPDNKRLFGEKHDPAEFELLEKQERKDEDE